MTGSGAPIPCALSDDGALTCWHDTTLQEELWFNEGPFTDFNNGENICTLDAQGLLVDWGFGGRSYEEHGDGWVDVSCGLVNSCAVHREGYVWCWGSDTYGQSSPPTDVLFSKVAVSPLAHACGIRQDGGITCWGGGTQGENAPLEPPEGVFTQLSAHPTATCALRDDTRVVCWGFLNIVEGEMFVEVEE
ncbi:MAG: hypothetical protein H6739_32285 [Alphaproteobacteria bacterium]|nr:hypothetical protein [Alphaproteobacteria bacterium]